MYYYVKPALGAAIMSPFTSNDSTSNSKEFTTDEVLNLTMEALGKGINGDDINDDVSR